MDPVTHGVVGVALAQSISVVTPERHPTQRRSYWFWGAVSALMPDIDYLLFWLDPLSFLAYWHRSVTHSLLLAPLWSLTIAAMAYLLTKHRLSLPRLWLITTTGVLSHCLIDGLTPFGTQWFQPVSDTRVSANLLLVVDGYFSVLLLICLLTLLKYKHHRSALTIWLLPMVYLMAVAGVKTQVRQALSQHLPPDRVYSGIQLMPQPFSPLLWQALIKTSEGSWQARVYYGSQVVPLPLAIIPPLADFGGAYRQVDTPDWRWRPLWPESAKARAFTRSAWQQPQFKPYRDFATNPVLYRLSDISEEIRCAWFSDLRYHWPGIPPAFRFGLCQQPDGLWQVERLPYFASP